MNPRRLRLGLLTLLAAAAGIAVVVAALTVFARPEFRVRWDVTGRGLAGVSERTGASLAALPEGSQAVAFLFKEDRRLMVNGDVVYPKAFARLRNALEDARIRAGGRVDVVILEEFGSPIAIERWTKELEREPGEVLILETADGTRRKFLFNELFQATDPLPDGTPARLVQERVDGALGDAALRLARDEVLRAGVVTASTSLPMDREGQGLRAFRRLIQSEGLDPVLIDGPASEDAYDVLVVVGQDTPLSPDDARAAAAWIEAGRPLFLALGPTTPTPIIEAWNARLEATGLQFGAGVVARARPRAGVPPGDSRVRLLPIESAQISGQHPASQALAESGRFQALASVRPVLIGGGSNDYLRSPLLRSGADAWLDVDPDYAPGPREERGAFTLAAAANRWEADDATAAGRTVLLGSAISLTGNHVQHLHEFLAGSFRWLAGQEEAPGGLVALHSLPLRIEESARMRITNLATLALPGFTLLFALLMFWRRRR